MGSKEVIDKYSNYMSETMFSISDNSESSNKNVQCIVTQNETVATKTCNIAREHSFTLSHVLVDLAKSDDDKNIMRKVNSWCKEVWEHMAHNGLCVVLFSGKRGGANGACFIQVKRLPVPRLGIDLNSCEQKQSASVI